MYCRRLMLLRRRGGRWLSSQMMSTTDLLGSTGSVTIAKDHTIVLNGEESEHSVGARYEQIIIDPTTTRRSCRNVWLRLVGVWQSSRLEGAARLGRSRISTMVVLALLAKKVSCLKVSPCSSLLTPTPNCTDSGHDQSRDH